VSRVARRLARRALLAIAIGLAALVPSASHAQSTGARFEIREVGDSTISFTTGRADWVRPGLRGLALDPAQRDVLVARFEVVQVREGAALALITGATRPITLADVAVLPEPTRSITRHRGFWGAVGLALLAGFGLGRAL
jgi:hypothetical protein